MSRLLEVGMSTKRGSMRRVETSRWGQSYLWGSLEEFTAADSLLDGVHSIDMSRLAGTPAALDMYVHLSPGAPLAVHFYGAQRIPRKSRAPIFGALSTSKTLRTSYVLLHDPTLSLNENIGLGWYEGYRGFAAGPAIRAALNHIIEISKSPRTVLWGGSAGGYAALRHVGSITNAAALVWNPQTSIPRYRPGPVQRYAQIAFGTDDIYQAAAESPGMTIDLTTLPRPNWLDAHVVYLQEADDRHVRRHLSFLLKGTFPEAADEVRRRDTMFGLLSPNFYLHQSMWEPGHVRPPKPAITDFLVRMLDTDLSMPSIFTNLKSASQELIRLSKFPKAESAEFEMDAPLRQPKENPRIIQWGSRFGRDVISRVSTHHPILVSRSILGQSIITAFSIRNKTLPKTAIDFAATHNNEQRLVLLRDRRASASSALNEDPSIDFVVIDLLEEVRGTLNAGNGLIVTNHGYLRRVDGSSIVEHGFGTDEHGLLWSSRLDRLRKAVERIDAKLVVIDIDAAELRPQDWVWMGIPQPSDKVLEKWPVLINEARERLKNATWVSSGSPLSPLIVQADRLSRKLVEIF